MPNRGTQSLELQGTDKRPNAKKRKPPYQQALTVARMTWGEFDAYWRNHHGAVVKSVPEFIRHVRKYVQCHLVRGAIPLGAAGAYDGVAELWFDSVEELEKAFNEPRYLEIIRPDEFKFVDLSKCMSFITEELQVV